jgi:hypothetical protein
MGFEATLLTTSSSSARRASARDPSQYPRMALPPRALSRRCGCEDAGLAMRHVPATPGAAPARVGVVASGLILSGLPGRLRSALPRLARADGRGLERSDSWAGRGSRGRTDRGRLGARAHNARRRMCRLTGPPDCVRSWRRCSVAASDLHVELGCRSRTACGGRAAGRRSAETTVALAREALDGRWSGCRARARQTRPHVDGQRCCINALRTAAGGPAVRLLARGDVTPTA